MAGMVSQPTCNAGGLRTLASLPVRPRDRPGEEARLRAHPTNSSTTTGAAFSLTQSRHTRWLLTLFIVGGCALGCSTEPEAGGEWVETSAAPFVVRLTSSSGACTGAKIGPRIFVTARHCLPSITTRTIEISRAEGEDRLEVIIEAVAKAPAETSVLAYDLAFLAVDRDSPMIQSADFRVTARALPTPVSAYGFGCGKDSLRRVTLTTMPQDDFAAIYSISPSDAPFARFDGPDELCRGDSGGPLVDEHGTVIGVLSRKATDGSKVSWAAKPDEALGDLLRSHKQRGTHPAWRDVRFVD
jgi:hypothetical protein